MLTAAWQSDALSLFVAVSIRTRLPSVIPGPYGAGVKPIDAYKVLSRIGFWPPPLEFAQEDQFFQNPIVLALPFEDGLTLFTLKTRVCPGFTVKLTHIQAGLVPFGSGIAKRAGPRVVP